MEFLFEYSTWYLMSERSERLRYQAEDEKRNSISTSSHVIFCSLRLHTNDDRFDDFPKISVHFPKIGEDSPKVVRKPDNGFRTFFRKYQKMFEDNRKFPRKNL